MVRYTFGLLAALLVPASASLAQCPPRWMAGDPGLRFTTTAPRAFLAWDMDGAGPLPEQLIVGGKFTQLGSITVNHIARWDGLRWSPLGSGVGVGTYSYGPFVSTLALWDADGAGPLPAELIAGGDFHVAGDAFARGIARWDGTEWRALGSGLGFVNDIISWDPDGEGPQLPQLFAGGDVDEQGPGFVVRWDGSQWQPLGMSVLRGINDLHTWDPDGDGPEPEQLIAAGSFEIDGRIYSNVARWNGTQWIPFAHGLDGAVRAVTTWDPDGAGPAPAQVVAGGDFLHAQDPPSRFIWSIARWDGSAWQAMDVGMIGRYAAIARFLQLDPDGDDPEPVQLFCSGGFGGPGGSIARWEGTEWRDFQGGITSEFTGAMGSWDPDGVGHQRRQLLVGGGFTYAGAARVEHFARWAENAEPWIVDQPQDTAIDARDTVSFTAAPAAGYGTLAYRWRRNGVNLVYGASGASPGGGFVSIPSGGLLDGQPATLTITGVRPSDAGDYDCVITHACGEVITRPAVLAVICAVDLTSDGVVDFSDYLEFLNLYEALDPRVDFVADGVIDFSDYLEFLNLFDAGC